MQSYRLASHLPAIASFDISMERRLSEESVRSIRQATELQRQIIALETKLIRLEARIEIREHQRAIRQIQWAVLIGSTTLYVVVLATALSR